MPTAMERVIWGSGDGSTLRSWKRNLGRIGSVICWENYMPLLRTAMYAKGSNFTVQSRSMIGIRWLPTVTHIALEGRCFVLSACQFLQRSDLPSVISNGTVPDIPGYSDPWWKLHHRPARQVLPVRSTVKSAF